MEHDGGQETPLRGTVVVTGATGMIGRPLTQRLIERGYRVVVFSRDPARARGVVPGAADYVAWTPEKLGVWAAHLDGAQSLIHLGGSPLFAGRVSRAARVRAEHERIESTTNLAQAMAQTSIKPQTFICASSPGAYGMSKRSDREVTEQTPPLADSWAKGNGAWKAAALPAEQLGIRTVLLRTGVVLGYDDGALVVQLPRFERGAGAVVRPGTQWMPWIHINDEVGIIVRCLEDERLSGPVNACSPNPARNAEFARVTGEVLGIPVRKKAPGFMLRLAIGEPARAILYNHRMLPKKILDVGYTFEFPYLDGAVRDIVTHWRIEHPAALAQSASA